MTEDREFAWKQCLLVRTDVRMSCGKMCAQAAHAAVSAFQKAGEEARRGWLSEGQKKVVLKAKDERTLHEVRMLAEARGIPASLIQDAGMTELPPGTVTALGLGPSRTEDLDRITSSFPLL
jgi:PTH2 family peptidyl-tRNA hydrolase